MLHRHRLLVTCIVIASVATFTAIAVVVIPRRGPTRSTAATYQAFFAQQAVRSDIHGEDKPPPVQSAYTSAAPPSPASSVAPVARLRIARIGVDAKVVTLGLTPSGDMDVPKSPELAGWYGFTAKPGLAGNAVFSGHLDWHDYGPAVFWKLKDLRQGDQIAVQLTDGTVITYTVTTALSYALDELPMAEILAPTASQSVTLITCGGTFSGGEYSDRLVVRAVRTDMVQTPHD